MSRELNENVTENQVTNAEFAVVEPVVEQTVEPVIENVPVVEEVVPPTIELIATTPTPEEIKPENIITAVPTVVAPAEAAPTPTVDEVLASGSKVAVYTLRSLTLPSGTIAKGYSLINKSEFDKVANHKAIRLATDEEIKTYLK